MQNIFIVSPNAFICEEIEKLTVNKPRQNQRVTDARDGRIEKKKKAPKYDKEVKH